MNVKDARIRAIAILTSPDIPEKRRSGSPVLDTDVILSHLLGITRSGLFAHPETELDGLEGIFFEHILRRAEGIPVAYITGVKEFWGLPFLVTPAVLIPKPDTEILVERAIELLSLKTHPKVLDVCTGSGCIAIALKYSCPQIEITATDISPEALNIARENARVLLPPNVITFLQQDLRQGLPSFEKPDSAASDLSSNIPVHVLPVATLSGWDLIVSNPPYVPSNVTEELLTDGRNEPSLALDGGNDGLDLVRSLALHSFSTLLSGGIFLVETGEYNARSAADYLLACGFIDIVIHKDLEGQDRVVEGRKP